LAVGGRNDRYPYIDIPPADNEPDPSILRQPLLGNIEICHDFHPAYQCILYYLGRGEYSMKHSVNPHAHIQFPFVRLYMDVACTLFDRLLQNGIQKTDDRGV